MGDFDEWLKRREEYIAPCVGCGFCCDTAPCSVVITEYWYRHGIDPGEFSRRWGGKCPELRREGDHYVCGLVVDDPQRFKGPLAIGGGCCMTICNERRAAIIARRNKE